jgi:DNA-directed RNA polymerase subunit alpha
VRRFNAITSVRIEGVDHEFSTIAEFEDVTEIILNLKQVMFQTSN